MIELMLLAQLFAAPTPKPAAPADTWTEFRGPNGTGHYTGPAVPTEWGTSKNVAWESKIDGLAWSTPILVKGKLYLTTAVPKGDDHELRVLCLDAATGKVVWNELVFLQSGKSAPNVHKKNSHASPTPVSDGERVIVHFGHMGLASYDLAGKQEWKSQKYEYKPMHGNGGSPILAEGLLVFSIDGNDKQQVVALDPKTCDEKWVADRKSKAGLKFTFTTPQLIEHDKKKQIISAASDFVCGYDPKTGDELWRASYPKPGWSLITRPIYASGLVIIQTGYMNQHLMAIDPSGSGDVTKSHVKWTYQKHAPNTPTPLVVGDELYSLSDKGVLVCLDIKTGKVHWEERLSKDGYSSSPILANGKIYATSESGLGHVVEPSTSELKVLASSELNEKTFATILPADGALYIRTETKLYKFAEKK